MLGGTSAFSLGELGLKGTDPSRVLLGIKRLLAEQLKADRWQHDLVNPSEDGLCWLHRLSVLKNAAPMMQSDPLPLHLYIRQMAIQLFTLLLPALF